MKKKLWILPIILVLLFSFAYEEQGDKHQLKKRASQFINVLNDATLRGPAKIQILESFIVKGPGQEEMAVFLYNSWIDLESKISSIKTSVEKVDIHSENTAEVHIQDIIVYHTGLRKVFLSQTKWIKKENVWYRETDKSILYENGVRVR